jgi:hypothetical protein
MPHTEVLFALCYLLDSQFQCRVRAAVSRAVVLHRGPKGDSNFLSTQSKSR